MSADKQMPAAAAATATDAAADETKTAVVDPAIAERERSEKILEAKELYSHGSRNFLVKSYADAADELSQVCALYEELYGELSDELGMPYLLYAKSLIALALDENKVIDVPDEEEMDDDDEDADGEESEADGSAKDNCAAAAPSSSSNGAAKLPAVPELADDAKKCDEADSTADDDVSSAATAPAVAHETEKSAEHTQVSSTDDDKAKPKNGAANGSASTSAAVAAPVVDGEKPSTSNGDVKNGNDEEEDENEAASNMQLAWEILELAAKIFTRQGMGGLPNLAEVQTELANIEFENNIPDAARADYEKALKIYGELPTNYRRAMAEIHYKIGLTYLLEQQNKEGAESLKAACTLIDAEVEEIKAKAERTEKDKNNIQDMEETKQEIWTKIAEIEDTQAQNIAEVRAALDSYIKPIAADDADADGAGTSSSTAGAGTSSSISSSTKPTNISHLIKRKKPEEPNSEAEAAASPAKRAAL